MPSGITTKKHTPALHPGMPPRSKYFTVSLNTVSGLAICFLRRLTIMSRLTTVLEFRELFGGRDEILGIAGTELCICAVGDSDAPALHEVRDGEQFMQIRPSDGGVHDYVAKPELRQLGERALQVPEETLVAAKVIMAFVGEVQGNRQLVHARLPQLQIDVPIEQDPV